MPKWIKYIGLWLMCTNLSALELDDIQINMDLSDAQVTTQKDSHYTLSYILGSEASNVDKLRAHRFEAGLEWEHHRKDLFLAIDSKAVLYGPNDLRLGEDDVDVDFKLNRAYAQYSRKKISLKFGYQTLNWGELDSTSVTDILSPWDFSEFVFTNPQDGRVGQALLQVNYFSNLGNWDMIVIPVVEVNQSADGLRSTVAQLLSMNNFGLQDNQPKAFSDMEWALRWKKRSDSGDLSFMAGSVLDNDPQLQVNLLAPGGPVVTAVYPRFEFVAANANYVRSKSLFQFEAMLARDRQIQNLKTHQLSLATGIEFTSVNQHRLAVNLKTAHNQEKILGIKQDDVQMTVSWSKSFINDTLSMAYYSSFGFNFDDMIFSYHINYQYSDAWHVLFNISLFEPGSGSPLEFTDNWDQISIGAGVDF